MLHHHGMLRDKSRNTDWCFASVWVPVTCQWVLSPHQCVLSPCRWSLLSCWCHDGCYYLIYGLSLLVGIASVFWISLTTGYSPTVGKWVIISIPPVIHCLLYSTWLCFPDGQWMAHHVTLTCHPSSLSLAFPDSLWMARHVAHDYKYHRTGYCRYHRQTCYSPDSR